MKISMLWTGMAIAAMAAALATALPQSPPQRPIAAAHRTIATAFAPPPGFRRIDVVPGSFGAWLRDRPLRPQGTQVRLFDGRSKPDEGIYAGVLDMDIGSSDLQQCADAVMRLRAEYLFSRGEFRSIGFHFTSGFFADYQHWRDGYRIVVSGRTAGWIRKAGPDSSYAQFRRYLETVFAYAGTRSLERELKPVAFGDMKPGDVLIRGGSPGHAVTVMDMAVNARGERCYLLSQSYMPAQDIHVLREPGRTLDGIWYPLTAAYGTVVTPEWTFTTGQLRRF